MIAIDVGLDEIEVEQKPGRRDQRVELLARCRRLKVMHSPVDRGDALLHGHAAVLDVIDDVGVRGGVHLLGRWRKAEIGHAAVHDPGERT